MKHTSHLSRARGMPFGVAAAHRLAALSASLAVSARVIARVLKPWSRVAAKGSSRTVDAISLAGSALAAAADSPAGGGLRDRLASTQARRGALRQPAAGTRLDRQGTAAATPCPAGAAAGGIDCGNPCARPADRLGRPAVAVHDDRDGDGRFAQHARHRRRAQSPDRRAECGQGVHRRAAEQCAAGYRLVRRHRRRGADADREQAGHDPRRSTASSCSGRPRPAAD